jgi:PAS domain S-box-containing protein
VDRRSNPRLSFRLPLDSARLQRARERIRDYLHERRLPARAIDDIVLAVEEAMTNAVRHSGAETGLEVDLGVQDGELTARVRDHGRGFDVTTFDRARLPDPLAPGGRGLYLIAQLMDDVQLVCRGGLEVHMYRQGLHPVDRRGRPAAEDADVSYETARRRTLFDEMAEGFATLDWGYRVTYGNRTGLEYFGLRLEDVLGRAFTDVFPSTRTLPVGQTVRRAMELGIPGIEEFVSPTVGRWIEVRVYPTASGVSLYVRDIEDRKRKERERDELLETLEQVRFQLSEAQRIAHVGSFEYIAETKATVWSDEESRIYGLGPDDPSPPYQVMLERYVHPEDAPLLDETFRRAVEGRAVYEFEHRIVRPDGKVRVVYDRAHPYFDDEGELVRYVGATHDVTDRKQAEDKLQYELARSRLLQDVAIAASTELDLEALARHVLDALRAHLQLLGGDVRCYQDGVLSLVAAFDYPEENLELLRGVDVAASDLLGAQAIRERRVITHEDETPGADRRRIPTRQGPEQDRYVYVPVEHRHRVMGLLSLTFAGRRPFREDELSLFGAVARVLGQAMENARLLATETEARRLAGSELEYSDALLRAAAALASSIDLQEVLETLGDLTLEALRVSRLIVLGYDHRTDELETLLVKGELPITPGTRLRPGRFSDALQPAIRGRATVLLDYEEAQYPPHVRDIAGETLVRRALWVPVVWKEEVLGVVGVDEPSERRNFTPREIELVEAICDQAAAAIANARAYEAQRTIATTLQESFRHPVPALRGLDVGLVEAPASQPALVGGDFWDAFELPDGRALFVIGDVAGKGVKAAGMTETVRSLIRAFASVDAAPAFVLRETGRLLLAEETREHLYVTALLAVVDQESGLVTMGSAGHPGPVYVGAETSGVTELEYGPPLGTFAGDCPPTPLQMEPGDYLVLYTDGVTEARRAGELFGEARLVDAARQLHGAPPQAMAEGVSAAAAAFASRLMDDLEVLVIRRRRPAA